MEITIGFILVILAGLGTGTAAWPFKVIKDIHFEQYLFFWMLLGIVIYPWIIVLIDVPDPILVIKTVGFKPLLISNLLTTAWGLANLLYMICVIRIGASLTGAILTALGMSVGVIVPLILKGSGLFTHAPNLLSKPGIIIMIGLLIPTVQWFLIMVLIYSIFQFVYTMLWRWKISSEGEMPFVPCLLALYIALVLIGGVA